MTGFIVECYWPHLAEATIVALVRQLPRTCHEEAAVRLATSLLVPSDGLVLLLFEAPSESDLIRCMRAAALAFDRIVEVVQLFCPRLNS